MKKIMKDSSRLFKDITVHGAMVTTTSVAMTALNILTFTNPILNISSNLAMQYVNIKIADKQAVKIIKEQIKRETEAYEIPSMFAATEETIEDEFGAL